MDLDKAIVSADVVLVEFYASWCPHCQRMMPVVAQVKELLEGRVPVYQYDLDSNSDAATGAEVESIPTFIIYKGGKVVGENDAQVLLSKVESFC